MVVKALLYERTKNPRSPLILLRVSVPPSFNDSPRFTFGCGHRLLCDLCATSVTSALKNELACSWLRPAAVNRLLTEIRIDPRAVGRELRRAANRFALIDVDG
jgi:hypothetical protein